MKLQILKDYESISHAVSDSIIEAIALNPQSTLCLATGHTPALSYKFLVEKVIQKNIDVSKCFFVGLDEWVGIEPQQHGTCNHFLYEHIFRPLNIFESNIYLFNSIAQNLENECAQMNKIISDRHGIDIITLGIGMNGHLGFNEPHASIDANAHFTELDTITKITGQKYFTKKQPISLGITIGLKQILQSKKIIAMASGSNKATIVKQMLEGEISTGIPASLLRTCSFATLYIDGAAASLLRND